MSIDVDDLMKEYLRSCAESGSEVYLPSLKRSNPQQKPDEQSHCERGVDQIEQFRIRG